MEFETNIGSFGIESIEIGNPCYMRLWTNAPIYSEYAKNEFERLFKGKDGLSDIVEIWVYERYALLQLSDAVKTEEQCTQIGHSFLQQVQAMANNLSDSMIDDWDTAVAGYYSGIRNDFAKNNSTTEGSIFSYVD